MEDNKPACISCKYSSDPRHGEHECRAKPPTYDYKNPYRRSFPLVAPGDWCAKYKFNEEFKVEPEPKLDENFQRALDEWTEDYNGS